MRSLLPSFDDFKAVVLESGFHIVAVTETWLSSDFPSSFIDIPSYTLFRYDRQSRGGGVGVYVSTIFKCTPIDVSFLEEGREESIEQLWLYVSFKNVKILLGVLYKPPTISYTKLKSIEPVLATMGVQFDYTILLGDLNIDFFNQSRDRQFLTDICDMFNLTQVINEPTRVSRSSSSLIDLIFMDRKLCVLDAGTVEMYNMTDHRLTYCSFCLNITKPTPKTIIYRDFKNFNLDLFNADMESVDWCSLSDGIDINRKVESFNSLLLDIFNTHAPLKFVQLKHPYRPYITDTIKEIIKLKDNAYNKFKKSGSQEHKELYLDVKNYLSFAIRSEKIAYMNFEINKINNNSKKLWSKFKEWGIATNAPVDIPNHLKNPNEINKTFANLSHLVAPVNGEIVSFFERHAYSNSETTFTFRQVTETDIYIKHSDI